MPVALHRLDCLAFLTGRNALTIVKPDTLIRWHRKGFRLFWKHKSRPRGRPCVPVELRKLIVEMAESNPTWGGSALPTNVPRDWRPDFTANDPRIDECWSATNPLQKESSAPGSFP